MLQANLSALRTFGNMASLQDVLGRAPGPQGRQRLEWVVAWAGQPNLFYFNALIHECGKEWGKAGLAFRQMQTAGVTPDVITYNSLISAYGRGEQLQKAEQAFEQMQAAGIEPNENTYKHLVKAYVKSGQVEKAAAMKQVQAPFKAERMADRERTNIESFNTHIVKCIKGGQWQKAEEAFERMRAAGSKPDIYTYNPLVSAYARGGQWQAAEETFKQMLFEGVKPDVHTHSCLIYAYAKGGQRHKAEEAFKRMQAAGVAAAGVTLSSLLSAFHRQL